MVRKKQSEKNSEGALVDLSTLVPGVTKFSESDEAVITDFLPTGLPNIDYIIGGGIPAGRMSEIYGVNGSGKSTLATLVTKVVQEMDTDVVWIDVEGTLETRRLEQLGLDPSKNLYLVKPPEPKGGKSSEADGRLTVEEVGVQLQTLIEGSAMSGRRMLIIWDSLGATPAKIQLEQGMEGKQIGVHAKAITALATLIGQDITKSSVALVVINQARDVLNGFVPGIDSGGGNAFKHWATLRLQINKGSAEAEEKINAYGKKENIKTRYTGSIVVKKSKISTPNTKDEFVLVPETGMDLGVNYFELLSKPSKYGILTRAGGYYQYTMDDGTKASFTKDNWIRLLGNPADEQETALMQELVQKMYMIAFPDWYPALDNEVIDIEKNPIFTGLRARYEAKRAMGAQATEGELKE